ncbi:hypothetical protein ACNI3K_12905 [Demequina sp. SO4-13]|uniref:hypothetical protein n=1 Tax=Demequina sp. SO4-13 TaxID=3401027 RepID=UPI003AF6ABF9
MPGDSPDRRALEPRAIVADSTDREARFVARAAAVAAAVALASIGLAYVAAQAGIDGSDQRATGVAQGDRATRASASVPEVDSPAVEAESTVDTVQVEPRPVDPAPMGHAMSRNAGTAGSDARTDRSAADAPGADGPPPPPGQHDVPDGEPERGGREWRQWWDSHQDAWADSWSQLTWELDLDTAEASIQQFDWTDASGHDIDVRG